MPATTIQCTEHLDRDDPAEIWHALQVAAADERSVELYQGRKLAMAVGKLVCRGYGKLYAVENDFGHISFLAGDVLLVTLSDQDGGLDAVTIPAEDAPVRCVP